MPPNSTAIKAGPTKAFFVQMLTRDIDLSDAILDLLDNCVDGIVRTLRDRKPRRPANRPYAGYWAHIVATPDKFEIWDNCGGIPREIAEKSAFMLGRPDIERDSEIETVGMYGIGMKRCSSKMGRHSVVESQPATGTYKVEIPPEWLTDDVDDRSPDAVNPWLLSLESVDSPLPENGTRIIVTELYDTISRHFNTDRSDFLDELSAEISRHYALILEKGFSVTLNDEEIPAAPLVILAPREIGLSAVPSIEPYVFVGDFNDVHVDLAIGFYRPLATEQQLEDEALVKSSRRNAGWTVICNDRVVLYADKTAKTGWGTGGVPGFHNQFIPIAGTVSFRSCNSFELPLNTTKRGLDTSSEVYHIVLDYMRDGMKRFTSFTNTWKRREDETKGDFRALRQIRPTEVSQHVVSDKFTEIRKHTGQGTGRYYAPELPKPVERTKTRRVCFSAIDDEIEVVAEYLFDDLHADRNAVGRACFDEVLERARGELS